MLIAYISADEVNRDLAARIGASSGAQVEFLGHEGPAQEGRFDVVLYDLESLTRAQREMIVAKLLERPSSRPVAVHFYNFEGRAEQLRERGVICSRKLTPSLLRMLCRSAASRIEIPPAIAERDERGTAPFVGQITVSVLGVAAHI
jgi:hypothetical protein